MGTEEANQTPTNWTVCNYAVSFIDLLGQRTKFADQGILPSFASDKEHQQFLTIVKESIGPIFALQRQADAMLRGFLKAQQNSPRRAALPPQLRASFDELQRTRITTQRWSDGLVSFVSLGDQTVKCPMNGIYCLFVLAGSHCLLGLAMQQPLRGAIELAWGVELRDGELYGPVVARAYELETTAAQYPRIVEGPNVMQLLRSHSVNAGEDLIAQQSRAFAKACLDILLEDVDGQIIVHYLGPNFERDVFQNKHAELYQKARAFVAEQYDVHKKAKDTKLTFRYSQLLTYFEVHPPTIK